ncbi:hypothetical protein KY359_06520 [Candidatus Woesearchaeota archaeon]|nr:hypothetical protein [Candidatus Woesearchaeota archaeon]
MDIQQLHRLLDSKGLTQFLADERVIIRPDVAAMLWKQYNPEMELPYALVGREAVTQAIACPDSGCSYGSAPVDIKTLRAQDNLLGVYHSHPNRMNYDTNYVNCPERNPGIASYGDIAFCFHPDVPGLGLLMTGYADSEFHLRVFAPVFLSQEFFCHPPRHYIKGVGRTNEQRVGRLRKELDRTLIIATPPESMCCAGFLELNYEVQ